MLDPLFNVLSKGAFSESTRDQIGGEELQAVTESRPSAKLGCERLDQTNGDATGSASAIFGYSCIRVPKIVQDKRWSA